MILNKLGADTVISIPNHREVRRGTLLRELRKAGLTVPDFLELLDR